MYKKERASQLRQAFWTTFGQYIAPHPSAEGIKANWINYNTGFRDVNFKMVAEGKVASIGIVLTHSDLEIQALFFEQFLALKNILHERVGEQWEWVLHTTDEYGKTISRIYKEISPVSIFNEHDWPALISFFKPRIIALDNFWSDAKYTFDALK